MEDQAETIRQHLLEVARRKDLVSYSDAGRWVGIDMSWESGRIHIAQLLDGINQDEVDEDRPMISALVIYKDKSMPGPGFFQCARRLGKLNDMDEFDFWTKEVKAVHDYWSSR